MPEPVPATTSLSRYEARTAAAVFERLFPADEHGPGAGAIGVLTYLDRAVAGAYRDQAGTYRLGLAGLDLAARQRADRPFADCDPVDQDALLAELEQGRLPGLEVPDQREFFALLRAHLQEGLFADPVHGGNRDKLGWRFLGHPGFWPSNTADENLATEPVTKGGVIQSLEDVADLLQGADGPREP
ncbi:MAG TPA: gluconate 2-dehydrogenase subunit 3 family protein, partial [Actinomycetes bacterium]|nr:gluconate 2-dehydrogenase subunit 3 family protein [Actinomycetes bacterium]